MIGTRSGRDKFIDGLVISFLAAACAATIALNIGQIISPGKILPTALSMRTGEMNENIIAGLTAAEENITSIKKGVGTIDAWKIISDGNFDLFFFIALILPGSLTKAVLTIGYFLRFGAASAAMYAFCCRHTGLRRLYSFLLGMMYSLSAQVILTAQFAPVMNMVILLPVALSCFDSYLRERTWKAFSLSCLACCLIAVSGEYGCLSGIPFLIVAALVLPVGLYIGKRKVFSAWLRLMAAIFSGVAMASFTVIPRFIGRVPSFDVVESFKTASMHYKLYDLLRHMFVAQSGGLETDMPPVFYIGMLTVEALILFWANFRIPTRVKVMSAIVMIVWYASVASTFVSGAVSIFGETPTLTASRLICLEVFLFFYAAIALRNISGVSSGALYAAFLVPLAFVVFSGNFYGEIRLSTTINLGTAAALLICGLLIRRLTLKPAGKKLKTFIAALGALAVTVNASFIMFNNTVSSSDTGVVMLPVVDETEVSDTVSSEEDYGLSVFSKEKRFLLLSEDIGAYEPSGFTDGFNHLSSMAGFGDYFEECKLSLEYGDQAEKKQGDIHSVGVGFSSITYELECGTDERIFVYSGFDGNITIRNTNGDFEEETDVFGPTLVEINGSEGKHELAFFFDLDKEEEKPLTVMRMKKGVSGGLEKATRGMTGDAFSFRKADLPQKHSGPYALITSVTYDASIKVAVNGRNCRTFDYLGLLGCVFDGGEGTEDYSVSIAKTIPGLSGGIALSAAVSLAIIAIPFIYKYSNNNIKRRKGAEETNAEQEDC
ncbi:MAG: YfhO family protein [Clostridiales bacterium]|nr:YfhO family protein [Clostridiales bacterium]